MGHLLLATGNIALHPMQHISCVRSKKISEPNRSDVRPEILRNRTWTDAFTNLEYSIPVWNPCLVKDVKLIEGIQ